MLKSSLLLMLALSVAASAQTSTTTTPDTTTKPATHSTTTHHTTTHRTTTHHTTAHKAATSTHTSNTAAPKAIIHTSMGDIHCTLMPDKAPIGVANFIGLANGTKVWTNPKTGKKEHGVPLYDGTIFHRVIPEFMIQGGDPLGNGQGNPGYEFKNETSPDLGFDQPGRLAYANAGPDTNGSQFFVTEAPYPSLNGGYTIFGQCGDPDVVQKIARVPRSHGFSTQDRPLTDVVIKHIEIEGAPKAARKPAVRHHRTTTTKKKTTTSTSTK